LSAVEEILADLPMAQLASQLGVDEATAETAARQAIPALLGGLQANSEDPAGASSLAGALGDHSGDLLEGGVDLNQVDTGDGERIVSNIFGRIPTRSPRPSAVHSAAARPATRVT